MSKKKLVLSIFLFLFLVTTAIVLPWLWQSEHGEPDATENTKEPKLFQAEALELTFLHFDELRTILSETQITNLKEQLISYFAGENPDIQSLAFVKNEVTYPDAVTVRLVFLLSDDTRLPVYYSTDTGLFSISEAKTVLDNTIKTYPKETDDTLPKISSEEIMNRQEGGVPDSDMQPPLNKEVQ